MKETIYFYPPTMHLDLFIFEPKTFSIQLIYSWGNTNNNKGLVTRRGRWRTPHHRLMLKPKKNPSCIELLVTCYPRTAIRDSSIILLCLVVPSIWTHAKSNDGDSSRLDFPLKSLFIYMFFFFLILKKKCYLNVKLCQYLILYER